MITRFKNCRYFGVLLLLFAISMLAPSKSISQDLFGILPNIPTSYVTKSKVTNSGDVYITLWGGGVFKSSNSGSSWIPINTGLTNFYLTDIEFISSGEILVSTLGGGLFKTTSLTNINWKEANTGLTNLNVKTIKTLPNGWVLVGTYGGGIFVSKDKGVKWSEANKGLLYKDITTIEVADNGWIVAGTYGGGIFQSRDTTKSWTRQNSGLKNLFINDIKQSSKGYLYAATNGRGVYLSPNDGIVWSELDTFMTRPLKLDPVPLPDLNSTCITFNKNNSPVFGSRYGGIYAEDTEEDFTWIPTNLRGVGVNTMSKNSTKMYSFFPYQHPHTSDNVGEVWNSLKGDSILALGRSPKILSVKEKEIIAYYDRIIKKSVDDGKTWTIVGATPALIYKIALDSTGDYLAATSKGLFRSDNTLSSWTLAKCLDTMVYDVEVSPRGSIFIITHYFKESSPPAEPIDVRKTWYTTDRIIWKEAPMGVDLKLPAPRDIAICYNANVYIANNKVLNYTTDNGVTWKTTPTFGAEVFSMGVMTDNTLWVGTGGNGLHKSLTVNSFERVWSYPANSIDVVYVGRDNRIFTSGRTIFVDQSYAIYESTNLSIDSGQTFTSINNNFSGESVMSFSINNVKDLYMSTSSGMIYRAINPENLTTPKVLTIPDKAVDVDVDSKFSWTSDKRAELYQLEIAYDDEFTYVWEGVTTSDTTHISALSLEPNHKYFWRVRSKNHSAVSDWSPVRTFISKLARPILSLPTDKSINISVFAKLHWFPVDGATKYKIQVSKDQTFASPDFEWNSTDTTSTSPLLLGRSKYYWRVMALNDLQSSNWSIAWSFETVFGPPSLVSPLNQSFGNSISPLMAWQKANEVLEYDIQISDNDQFTNIVFEQNKIPNLNITSAVLSYDKMYYWKVRSRNGDVVSEWSYTWRFLTGYAPVKLVDPANNAANVIIQTKFEWQEHETQSKYEIEVSKTPDFSSNIDYATVDNELTYTTDKLEAYADYYWRAHAISDVNTGLWSAANKFKTKVGQILLRYPDHKSANHPIAVGFIWYMIKGAKTYHLQIANDSEFNDLIFSQDTVKNTSYTFNKLNPGSAYFWRVRAVSPEGVGDWSEVWTFNTGNNIPVLIAPENGNAKVISPVKFQWALVGGALRYELQVSENTNFTSFVIKKDDITDLQYIYPDLAFPKTYNWRVRAVTAEGNSSWSQIWSFGTVDPTNVKEILTISSSLIYPNPASAEVTINLLESGFDTYEMTIVDMTGKFVTSASGILNNGNITLSASNLSNGLYFLNIYSGDKLFKGEIIISK